MGSIRLYVKIICKIWSREVKIWLLLNVFKLHCLWCLRTLFKLKYQRDLLLCKPCCRRHILLDCDCFFSCTLSIFTARKRSCRKIMFSQMSLCHSVQWWGTPMWLLPMMHWGIGNYPSYQTWDPSPYYTTLILPLPLPSNTRHGT